MNSVFTILDYRAHMEENLWHSNRVESASYFKIAVAGSGEVGWIYNGFSAVTLMHTLERLDCDELSS